MQHCKMQYKFDKGLGICKKEGKKFSYFFIKAGWFEVSGLSFPVGFLNWHRLGAAAFLRKGCAKKPETKNDKHETVYAVFVLYFTFLGNKSSVVKIKSKLMAVVDSTLIRKSRKLPKCKNSSRSR